jgi:hypothetical protein
MTSHVPVPLRRPRRRRRALLTVHVALSVGWLGASMVMLTLAVTARLARSEEEARSSYWAMHLLAGTLLVPLSVTVLLLGALVAATTPWGLLRHWWVLVKLVATSLAVILSLFALPAMTRSAFRAATTHALAAQDDAGTRLIIAGCASVALYLALTAISVSKPWGRTGWSRRPPPAWR